jgi:transcriptional regulator with XRE-family HTH domain
MLFFRTDDYHLKRKEASMDQTKIGSFLKELRKEKDLSQEELAERFNVSNRSISRWENGYTMPDISIIIELADFYDVDIRELLNGERKSENMKEELKETLTMVADYTNAEKDRLSKQLITYLTGSAVFFGFLAIILVFHLTRVSSFFEPFAIFCTVIGLIYSISGIVRFRQLTGKLDKDAHRKLWIRMIIFACGAGLLAILAILFGLGIIG